MADEITGRDLWIITEALATALVALEQLPAERQPTNNMEDMKKLLAHAAAATYPSIWPKPKSASIPTSIQ